jgi:hypothetical protein
MLDMKNSRFTDEKSLVLQPETPPSGAKDEDPKPGI